MQFRRKQLIKRSLRPQGQLSVRFRAVARVLGRAAALAAFLAAPGDIPLSALRHSRLGDLAAGASKHEAGDAAAGSVSRQDFERAQHTKNLAVGAAVCEGACIVATAITAPFAGCVTVPGCCASKQEEKGGGGAGEKEKEEETNEGKSAAAESAAKGAEAETGKDDEEGSAGPEEAATLTARVSELFSDNELLHGKLERFWDQEGFPGQTAPYLPRAL